MKFSFLKTAAIAAIMMATCGAMADDAAKKGAKVGKWTQDYDAAVALASESKLPVFLKFTGSDWCSWCMLMEDRVFSKAKFKHWAETNIVLVSIDFPRGKNVKTVPDDYRARNEKLASQYAVRGFPTYFILDPGGETIGRMGASRNASVETFLEELQRIIDSSRRKPDAAVSNELAPGVDAP